MQYGISNDECFTGENYQLGLDVADIAARVRRYIKAKYPSLKSRVNIKRYSGGRDLFVKIDTLLFKSPIEWEYDDSYINASVIENYNLTNCLVAEEKTLKMLKDIDNYVESFRHVDSDILTDLYHTNFFYFGLEVKALY